MSMRIEDDRTPRVDIEFLKEQFKELQEEQQQTNKNIIALRTDLRKYNEQSNQNNFSVKHDVLIIFMVSFLQYFLQKYLFG